MKTVSQTVLVLVLILSSLSAFAQQAPQIMNISGRQTTSLDGQWKTIVDPFENGYYDYRLKPYDGGYAQDKTYSDKTKLQEYDFETDKQLFVPGDWNTQRPQLYYYEGTVWYRKHFEYTLQPGKRLFLNFGAVNYEAIVWLNGKRLGSHIGGFTPFNFEITGLLKEGTNSLVVKADNKRRPEAVPTVNADWWNFGGITRPVSLIETPSTYIRDYYVQLKKDDRKMIEGWVQLDGSAKEQKIVVDIPDLKIKKEITTDIQGRASFQIKANPILWTPENPKLYSVNLSSERDKVSDEVGFRTIRTKGNKILLNDKEIFCRGISIHEETAYYSGRAYSRDHAHTLLSWAKELGCNFVRLAHYPHNEEMVREAERMGLLVWSEIPVYWTIHWENKDTYRNAEQQLCDMITRDKNRCNIIIWSIANETPVSESRLTFLTALANKARSMDKVRLIGAAMEKEEIKPGIMTVNDPLEDILDIISFNEYVGWYDGDADKCDRVDWTFKTEKPVFISELGGGALFGRHGSSKERFTEEYQEDLYIRHINMLKHIPGLAGTTPWILKDFRSPRRHVPEIQDDFNRKGLVSDKGQKKKAFFILQEWYQELTEIYK